MLNYNFTTLSNFIYKILYEELWAENSFIEKKKLSQLLVIWGILVLGTILFFSRNFIFTESNTCLICDIALVAMISLGLVCTLNGKIKCTLNTVFSIPLFIYAYFFSSFSSHPPYSESLVVSVALLSGGLIFLLFYSESDERVKFFFLTGISTLIFHLFKAGLLLDSFVLPENLISNPVLIFTAFFLTTYILRRKYTSKVTEISGKLESVNQSITKVFHDSKSPVARLKAERDEEGNIVQLNIDRVNHSFESTFKINLYEVQDQDANYIFELLFKNRFDLNKIIHLKKKKAIEFYVSELEKWFNIQALFPEHNSFYLIFNDITKTKKQIQELEENKKRYKVLLEAIPDIFFVIDKDGTYEDFVIKESDLFKIEDSDIIGSSIYDVGFPDNMADKIYSCIQSSLVNDSIESIEYSLNTPNGTFMYEMRLAKLSPDMVISISRDITKRKTAEFNLEKALVKAEESDRLKSAFLANLSHEIRTPMNVITNFSRILAETDLDQEDKLEITDAIAQNGKQLLNMIDNTIHLSKIETEGVIVNNQFCHVNILLRDIYNQFYPLIPDSRNIKLRLDLNIHNKEFGFVTDRHLLGEVISILVDNAVKYTLQGQVSISYEMIRNELIKFVVSDTGIGIPDNEFKNIFNRFYRLTNNINESTSGSGLGLSIAQHYVEKLGGKLEFESTQNMGTKFFFTLHFKEGSGFMTLVS